MESKRSDASEIDYHLFNIFRIDNRDICLLCMESISHDTHSSISEDEPLVTHLQSETHKMKVKSLFKECISDPFVDSQDPKYTNVVSSCVFDISHSLGNDPSYVSQHGDYFICILCSKKLCKTDTAEETLVNVLFDHLRSELHMQNMKNCMCWLYFFSENHDFVMISQSIMYCSLCKQTVRSTDETLLQALVYHLDNEHRHHPQRRVVEDTKKSSSDLESVCSHFETLNIVDDDSSDDEENNLPQPGNAPLDSGNDLTQINDLSQTDNDLSQTDNDLSQTDNDLSQTDNDLSQSDNDLSQSDSDSSGSEDYDDTLEVLTCPDCGEFIEIFNENAEFSLQFHSQKHRDPKSISCDRELEFNPNIDYVCPICQEVIPIFNRNIELSVSLHFEERKADHEGLRFAKDNNEARPDFIAHVFSKFPGFMKKYQSFLVMEAGKIVCKLCNCTIPVMDHHIDISDKVCEHICSSYHEDQFKSLSQNLALVVVDFNKQYQGDQVKQQPDLFEIIVRKHPLIKDSRKFIEKHVLHYFCILCQKNINYSPNEAMQTLNFVLHLKGSRHEKSLKQKDARICGAATESSKQERTTIKNLKETGNNSKRAIKNKIFLLSQKSVAVNMNQRYIKIKKGKLSCSVCCQSIKCTDDGSHLTSHCNSTKHNETLTRNALIFISRLECGKFTSNGTKNNVQLRTVLSELATNEFLKPHITYVIMDKKGCRCIICNTVVFPTKQSIKKHFFDAAHKKNAFSINQQVKYHSKHNAIPTKQVMQRSVEGLTTKTGVLGKKQPTSESQKTDFKSGNVPSECNKKVKKLLHKLSIYSGVVKNNYRQVDIKNGLFFCKVCCETVNFSGSGKHLVKHLKSKGHINLRKK